MYKASPHHLSFDAQQILEVVPFAFANVAIEDVWQWLQYIFNYVKFWQTFECEEGVWEVKPACEFCREIFCAPAVERISFS